MNFLGHLQTSKTTYLIYNELVTFIIKVTCSRDHKTFISVMTVVENHSGAGGIQYIFTPKWTYWEDLLISCKTTWCRAIKNRAFSVFKVTFHTLKPPKFFWKKNSLKNLKLEEQLLVKWLSILIFYIKVYLVKIGLIFDGSASSCLTRYQHILSVCSLRCKNVLNSTCTTMIFHNRHHTSHHSFDL